jgi:hypothetical protein
MIGSRLRRVKNKRTGLSNRRNFNKKGHLRQADGLFVSGFKTQEKRFESYAPISAFFL